MNDKEAEDMVEFFVRSLAETIEEFAANSALHLMANFPNVPRSYIDGYELGCETIAMLLRRTLADWQEKERQKREASS